MGLNILLERLDGTRHPEWDDSKMGGDRELAAAILEVPFENEPDYDPWRKGDVPLQRPTDMTALEDIITKAPEGCEDRWRHFVAILRDEPDYSIYWSC